MKKLVEFAKTCGEYSLKEADRGKRCFESGDHRGADAARLSAEMHKLFMGLAVAMAEDMLESKKR